MSCRRRLRRNRRPAALPVFPDLIRDPWGARGGSTRDHHLRHAAPQIRRYRVINEFKLDPPSASTVGLNYWGQTPISLRCRAPHPQGEPKAWRIGALTPKTQIRKPTQASTSSARTVLADRLHGSLIRSGMTNPRGFSPSGRFLVEEPALNPARCQRLDGVVDRTDVLRRRATATAHNIDQPFGCKLAQQA